MSSSRNALIFGLVIAMLAVGGVAVYAFTNWQQPAPNSDQSQADTPTGSSDPASDSAPTPSERVAISFTNSGFEPTSVTVKKGTVITVTNNSSEDVQFSSDEHPSHRDNTEMNLPVLSPGESDSYTANTVGTWGFHDHLNDEMTGTITVTE
mgnify:CR=1 FL=1